MIKTLLIHPDELTEKRADEFCRAGVDVIGLHPTGGKNAADSLAALVEKLGTREYRDVIDYAIGRGLKIEYCMHAFSYLLPRDLFGKHPEYFRVGEDGKRTSEYNLCASSPEAVDILSDNAVKLAKSLYRSRDRFYFWADDADKRKCNCDKCKNLSFADQQIIVLGAVARKLRKVFPDAGVSYLAYFSALDVPKTAKEDGVFLEYAPFLKWTKGDDGEKTKIPALLGYFGKENSRVLEYWYDNSLFSHWRKPPVRFTPDEEKIRRDADFYAKCGFEEIASFACFLGDDYEELYGKPDFAPFVRAIERATKKK